MSSKTEMSRGLTQKQRPQHQNGADEITSKTLWIDTCDKRDKLRSIKATNGFSKYTTD